MATNSLTTLKDVFEVGTKGLLDECEGVASLPRVHVPAYLARALREPPAM